MVILDLIVLVISNAPYVPPSSPLREGDEGEGPEARLFYESKEGMLEVLFGCPAFVSLIHSLAVNPGRAEVEDSLMGLQECMVDAAFWEKDLTFVRDDPVHEVREGRERESFFFFFFFFGIWNLDFFFFDSFYYLFLGKIDGFVGGMLSRYSP